MAAKTTNTNQAPLTRLARSMGRQYLSASALGGALTLGVYSLLTPLAASPWLQMAAAVLTGVGLQMVGIITVKHYALRQLAPIDQALTEMADLAGEGTEKSKGLAQRLLDRRSALVAMQRANAQSLLDAKLVGVRLHHLENVLNTLPVGVIVFDNEAKVSFANRALAPMIGQPSSDLIDKRVEQWCDIPALQEYLLERVVERQHSGNDIIVNHPKRPDRWIRVELRDLIDTDARAHVACVYDCTDAVQAQKARGEFVTSLSHELKTPLHTMNLYAESLRGPDGEDAEIRLEAANVIGDEVERIDSLIRNLLDATRIETGSLNLERTRVRLPELVRDSLNRLQPNMHERGITLVSNIPDAMQPLYMDKALFSVALNNLLSNAIKYNRDQGSITVEIKESEDDVAITIADSGVGIPEQDLPYVFDKFYRASNVGQDGHGVGLSLAREIVQKHHGRLTVDSAEGNGTTFTLALSKSAALTREAA